MRSDRIIEAVGQIDDTYLSAAIEAGDLTGGKAVKMPKRHACLKWAAMIAVVIGISLVTAFTANAQFREWVISLFQFLETEEVPPPMEKGTPPLPQQRENVPAPKETNAATQTSPAQGQRGSGNVRDSQIDLYADGTLDEIFNVQYLQSDSYLDRIGNVFYYVNDENNTIFYAAENNEFIEVPSARIEKEVSLLGVSGSIDYDYCRYQGKTIVRERARDRFMTDAASDAEFLLSVSDDNQFILTLYKNPQSDEFSYSAIFDIETGKVTDLFEGIYAEGTEIKDYTVLRSWEDAGNGLFTVSLGTDRKTARIYLIDTSGKRAVSVSELTGIEDISSVKVIDGKFMILENCPDGKFNYYCYDYSEDTRLTIYEHAQYWTSDTQEQEGLKVKFSGGRYDCVKEAGRIYLADEQTGKRMSVEGLTDELAESIIINEKNDKLLVSAFSEDGISRIGVIDVRNEVFYLLDRKNSTGAHEYSIGWDGDRIMINAANEDWTESYIYLYSLR